MGRQAGRAGWRQKFSGHISHFQKATERTKDILYNTIHTLQPHSSIAVHIQTVICSLCRSIWLKKKKTGEPEREQIESFNKIFSHLLLFGVSACIALLYIGGWVCAHGAEGEWRLKDVTTLLFTASMTTMTRTTGM